jgi:hypothetical protein
VSIAAQVQGGLMPTPQPLFHLQKAWSVETSNWLNLYIGIIGIQ